mmetsp:Transcript_2380/g.6671  ORF Transcript_2380/g.6671 Transcript_2380/m.6671 type:complete len:324 (-) Transcript_2380:2293-3264(-)
MASDTTTPTKKPLTIAPPPWHSIVVFVCMTALFLYWMPSLETLDEVARVETFTHRLFPDLLSLKHLGYLRLVFAGIFFATQLDFFLTGSELVSTYLPGSKLIPTALPVKGFRTFWPFTCVTWNILGTSFAIAGYIALQQAKDEGAADIPHWLLRAGIITWSMTAPHTALVSIVVRYALWPIVLKQGGNTDTFTSPRALLMHNFNIFSAICELSLLGGLPVRWCDVSFGPLLGCAYILATWFLQTSWGVNHQKYGPQFLYFFFDTTQPGHTPTTALLALLGVLLVFFALFASLESTVLPLLPGGVWGHVALAATVCGISMKFQD